MLSGNGQQALRGRRAECEEIDRLVAGVKAGQSRVLVLRGEPGVGKTALLDYLVAEGTGCEIARTAGVEAEAELAFAGLQRLCAPMLDRLEQLPAPQRDALGTVFGLKSGDAPDRFLVGLAVYGLLSGAAAERPLICVVDDLQWLDTASAQMLMFVARRLLAESVALVFACPEKMEVHDLAGLPVLRLAGLADDDAGALLESVLAAPLDRQVRDRIVAETGGNPLALLELPRGLSPEELAGGFGLPDATALSTRIEESFRRRLAPLPDPTRRLLLLAAAEPIGDPLLIWRAASEVDVGFDAAAPAIEAGLIDFGANVRFRHPLVRSAVYRAASRADRHAAHQALASATDPVADPDRRAWHRAQATAGLDEEVAAELEQSADRAHARGGLAAAAAFLERAAELTPERGLRARRALAAAQSKHLAGAPRAALRLLAIAQAGPLGELEQAHAQLLRAQITFATSLGRDAPAVLFDAARNFESLDSGLARETYLDAFSAALFAGRFADGTGVREIAQAVLDADWHDAAAQSPRATDRLLEGLALLALQGYAAATPTLRIALEALCEEDLSEEQSLRWLWLASHVARAIGDDAAWDDLTNRLVRVARDAGALSSLPVALNERFRVELYSGEPAIASALAAEAQAATEAAGSQLSLHGELTLAAWEGRDSEALAMIDASRQEVSRRGEGMWLIGTEWTRAELLNSLGRWSDALAAAEWVAEQSDELGSSTWVCQELIEAASRSGNLDRAEKPLERLSEMARASGTDWALGVEKRSRALVSSGETAERLYRESVGHLRKTRIRIALARTHLVYGEWLRREGRRVDAREQLRIAHELFNGMGAHGFAERARRELLATGETARKRVDETRGDLTAQEAQIARLAAEGHTNPEIGARLFISARTVEWHLRKVYPKLGVNSRRELRTALLALPLAA